ncbi:hypothetical protein ACFW9L_18460 [Streptomyces sp. NPDC059517]|uniref:hypothetical protein n=1 Tax=Streptomyces sp. NPDC059517 TaxID=3346855 RepID=UPI0036971B2E
MGVHRSVGPTASLHAPGLCPCQLAADEREHTALAELADGCGQETVDYEVAP